MAVKVKNSLSTFLEQAMILEKNNLETISKINDAVSTNEDYITLTLTDTLDPDKTRVYQIPSFGYLKNAIERLDATLSTLTNVGQGTGSSIKLSDGTYRKIIASKIPTEAPTITSVNNVTNFNFKSNWFFEDMLNPCLYITWDLSNQISSQTEKIIVQRYILSCNTTSKRDVFEKKIKGRNNIDYQKFLQILTTNNISYTLDKDIRDLTPCSKRYSGNFSVIKITSEIDTSGSAVKRYTLSSLEYTDNKAGMENTRMLSVGDYVEVNSDTITTRYKVTYASTAENKIGLKLIEGMEGVKIGANVLRISSSQDLETSIDIPVTLDERLVIFIKPIDPDSHIPASNWSPGVGLYTNELTLKDSSGSTQTLQKFYQQNVVDFGQILLSYAADYYPSIREGLKPNKPVLNYENGVGDFKIVKINGQLTESMDTEQIRGLVSNKVQIQNEITSISREITEQKKYIQTTDFISESEKTNAQNELVRLVNDQNTLLTNYSGIIGGIKSKYEMMNTSTPKYRIRGFWAIPDAKVSYSSGVQEIIKFKIRYRYLNNSGQTNREEEFTYTSNRNQLVGKFSNWIEIESKLRDRVKTQTGWEWAAIDTSDPDVVNINQLDIPIQKGECVEIQVKSVSEAGWPSNPMESDWSNSITVAFSDFSELESDDISDLIDQNTIDSSIATIIGPMMLNGEHTSTSFYSNDKYYAHTAETITSGFLTEEQSPISLYDKLHDIQNQITLILEKVEKVIGHLVVTLIDNNDVNKVYTLEEGNTTYVYAGNYLEDIENINENQQNGAIITKTFYVDIKCDNLSGLQLLSKLSGNRLSMCPASIEYMSSDTIIGDPNVKYKYRKNLYKYYDNVITPTSFGGGDYYKTMGRYDLVPINISNGENIDFQTESPNLYQSAQCRGQIIYSRFRNIGDTFDMYTNTSDSSDNKYAGSFNAHSAFSNSEINYGSDTVLSYMFCNNTLKYNAYNNKTAADINFTEFADNDVSKGELLQSTLTRLTKTWLKPQSSKNTLLSNRKILLRINEYSDISNVICHNMKLLNRYINLNNGLNSYTIEPKIQATYGFSDQNPSTKEEYSYLTTHKIGYEDNDRYAIGEETCTSYLFLSPVTRNSIQVDGDGEKSSAIVNSNNSIRVPIIYQYRMTDYKNNIFGKSSQTIDETVTNTKFANIIGLDIWTDTTSDKPNQYDIIFYSTYSNSSLSNFGNTTLPTQTLVRAVTDITNNVNFKNSVITSQGTTLQKLVKV